MQDISSHRKNAGKSAKTDKCRNVSKCGKNAGMSANMGRMQEMKCTYASRLVCQTTQSNTGMSANVEKRRESQPTQTNAGMSMKGQIRKVSKQRTLKKVSSKDFEFFDFFCWTEICIYITSMPAPTAKQV